MARPLFSESVSVFLLLLAITLFISKSNAQTFNLVQDSSGSTFFDKWNFAPTVGTFDNTTNGDVFFVTKDQVTSAPQEQKLAFANSNGNAILRVDNFSTVAYPEKRNTVRITSQSLFNVGSLFVTDMLHIPFGCSVWPSFWTQGVNWPQDGEIDIIEGINQNTQNQMALHATAGCMHSQITDPTKQVGKPGELNCNATGNIGCTVLETKPNSFGQSFSQNGGGVFATQFDTSGIFIWYWPRSQIPASIKASTSTSSMSIDDWGAPSASYPNSPDGCDIPKFFDAQSLVLEITLCGDWAGAEYFGVCGQAPPTTTTGTLPPPAPTDVAKTTCYNERVLGPPSGYNDAFFEIQWLRVYAAPNTPAASAASSASSAPQATSSGNSTTSNGATAGGSDATKFQVQWSILITVITLWFGRGLLSN